MVPPQPGDSDFSYLHDQDVASPGNSPQGESQPSGASPSNGVGAAGQLVPVAAPNVSAMPVAWQEAYPQRPEILTAKPDPISIAKALKRNWLLASILGFTVGTTCFVLAWMFIPLYYEIEAHIQVERMEDTVGLSNKKPVDSKALDNFLANQPFLVKSTRVLDAALRDPSVSQCRLLVHEPDKRGWLRENLIVGYLGESGVMEIKMRDEYPQELVKIVNKVQEAYLREIVNEDMLEKTGRLDKMNNELRQRQEAIAELEKRINVLSGQIGYFKEEEASSRERILLSRLTSLEHNRSVLERDMTQLDTKIISLAVAKKLAGDEKMTNMAIQDALMEDPEIRGLETQIRALKRLLAEQSQMATRDSAPALQGIRRDIQRLQEQLEQVKQDVVPMLKESYQMKTLVEVDSELAVALQAKEGMKAQLEEMTKNIADVSKELDGVRKFDSQISQLVTQIEPMKATATKLQEECAALEIDTKMQQRITLLSPATMPEGRDRTAWLILVAFCGVAGFVLTVGGFGLQQFFQRRIDSSAQVSQGLGLTVIGSLPELASSISRGGSAQAAVQAMLADSIDAIRTRLICGDPDHERQIIMVTSAVEQEGKSTVASQLAASLARGGRKTLLIDADLRRPTVHELFGMETNVGLSELLRGETPIEDTLRGTESDDLWVMTAGQWDHRSIQALATDSVSRIFANLRSRFDYIIVDSGPVLSFSDSLLLGQYVDTALLAVRKDRSQIHRTYEAYERLAAVNVDFLGAVVNGESPHVGRRTKQLLLPVQV